MHKVVWNYDAAFLACLTIFKIWIDNNHIQQFIVIILVILRITLTIFDKKEMKCNRNNYKRTNTFHLQCTSYKVPLCNHYKYEIVMAEGNNIFTIYTVCSNLPIHNVINFLCMWKKYHFPVVKFLQLPYLTSIENPIYILKSFETGWFSIYWAKKVTCHILTHSYFFWILMKCHLHLFLKCKKANWISYDVKSVIWNKKMLV